MEPSKTSSGTIVILDGGSEATQAGDEGPDGLGKVRVGSGINAVQDLCEGGVESVIRVR